jgi:hypothetical protein
LQKYPLLFGTFRNTLYLCRRIKKNEVMTTIQMNAELFRELNIIMTDESMMEKAIKALRRITRPSKRLSKAKAADQAIDWDALPELPEEFLQLRGMVKITKEDMANDDRLAYIMGK